MAHPRSELQTLTKLSETINKFCIPLTISLGLLFFNTTNVHAQDPNQYTCPSRIAVNIPTVDGGRIISLAFDPFGNLQIEELGKPPARFDPVRIDVSKIVTATTQLNEMKKKCLEPKTIAINENQPEVKEETATTIDMLQKTGDLIDTTLKKARIIFDREFPKISRDELPNWLKNRKFATENNDLARAWTHWLRFTNDRLWAHTFKEGLGVTTFLLEMWLDWTIISWAKKRGKEWLRVGTKFDKDGRVLDWDWQELDTSKLSDDEVSRARKIHDTIFDEIKQYKPGTPYTEKRHGNAYGRLYYGGQLLFGLGLFSGLCYLMPKISGPFTALFGHPTFEFDSPIDILFMPEIPRATASFLTNYLLETIIGVTAFVRTGLILDILEKFRIFADIMPAYPRASWSLRMQRIFGLTDR